MPSRLKAFANTVWAWIRRHPLFAVALIIVGVAIDAFFELAEELPEGSLSPFDTYVQRLVQHYQSHGLFLFSLIMTRLLVFPYVVIILLVFLVYLLAARRYVLAAGIAIIPSLAGLLITLLKSIYHRQRPAHELLITPGYSFPSGHAFSSVVIYGLLGYVVWQCFSRHRWQRVLIVIVVVLLVLATGFARVYLGVHYPSDVVGGWIAGSAVLFGSIVLLEILQKRWR